jgi:hypothetical protein
VAQDVQGHPADEGQVLCRVIVACLTGFFTKLHIQNPMRPTHHENNNTLKTKGYHFEHNYGHGRQYLSSVLASLIILAFLVHTVPEWMDDRYQLLRRKLRQRVFSDIRTLTRCLCFESWETSMTFMLQSFKPVPPQPETG